MARKNAQKKKEPDNKPEATNGHGEPSEAKPFQTKKQPKKEANGIDPAEETVPRFDKARVRTRNQRQNKSRLLTLGVQIRNVLEKIEVPDNAFTRRLKGWVFSGQKAVNEWAKRNQPLIDAIKAKSEAAWARGRAGFDVVYPVVVSIGAVAFLVSVIWLDSFVRGLDSFFRMGTAAFFSVVWCAVFSTIAMAGIFNFLAVLAIAALVGLFARFSLGFLILGFFGALFLWLYGSFWTTTLVVLLGGVAYGFGRERVALLITTVYSVYCGLAYVGWLGLVVAFNLAFVSSDVLIYFLKNSVNQQRRPAGDSDSSAEQEQTGCAFPPESGPGFSTDRGPGMPSTSGAADSELTSDDEIVRLLNCGDHYSALGLARFETVDISLLKREYKKKAMLVHPDKNMGNEKAVEAFKKLQNAYEVLLDSAKQKAYDDELKKEELLNIFHRFQNTSQMKGRPGFFASGMAPSEGGGDEAVGESRRIACKKCNNFHVWVLTRKTKSRARWCQECKEFHQAKDGDGWVEQSSQPLLFGLLQKVDSPAAFVCADSKIYDASEWYICQGMRCAPNTHKPSFQVNTTVASSKGSGSGSGSGQRGRVEDCVTEEDFFEWLQSAVQSGAFDNMNMNPDPPSPAKPGSANAKRKKKGKKQW